MLSDVSTPDCFLLSVRVCSPDSFWPFSNNVLFARSSFLTLYWTFFNEFSRQEIYFFFIIIVAVLVGEVCWDALMPKITCWFALHYSKLGDSWCHHASTKIGNDVRKGSFNVQTENYSGRATNMERMSEEMRRQEECRDVGKNVGRNASGELFSMCN